MRSILCCGLLAILLVGCAHKPKIGDSYVVLMENADGSSGKITYSDNKNNTATIDQPGNAVHLEKVADGTYAAASEKVAADFFEATAARPEPPVSFMLYFESGDVKLTPESEALIQDVLREVENHAAPDVSIIGHTDTVGTAKDNAELGMQRAQVIASMIKAAGLKTSDLTITSHGERNLLVSTPDNTDEPRNRRVEITVR
jgi:outer membrane protein OmpA-like peptidoglycan-associated protein